MRARLECLGAGSVVRVAVGTNKLQPVDRTIMDPLQVGRVLPTPTYFSSSSRHTAGPQEAAASP